MSIDNESPNPLGYAIVSSRGDRSLVLDQQRATEKAAQLHGTVTPLFSINQIVKALEARGQWDPDAGEAVDIILAMNLGVLL